MNYKTAEDLLMYYPIHSRRLEVDRSYILGAFASVLANTGSRHGIGSYSDPTAKKGVRLASLGEDGVTLNKVVAYMDTLSPEDREFVLSVWRCGSYTDWKFVSRHMWLSITETHSIWKQLVTNFQAFVGIANGPAGDAFVVGQKNQTTT